MNAVHNCVLLSFCMVFCSTLSVQKAQCEATAIDANTQQVRLSIPLEQGEYIYADTIAISVDKPGIVVSKWNSSIEPTIRFDQQFRTSKRVIEGNPLLTLTISRMNETPIADASLRLVYRTNKSKTTRESFFPLTLWTPEPQKEKTLDQEVSGDQEKSEAATTAANSVQSSPEANVTEQKTTRCLEIETAPGWSSYLTSTMKCCQSLWLQLLLAFLLGILMSLTPCIYPMIPITMGILQAHGTRSMLRNFFLALSYTMGIATTFAALGLTAALAGQLMGSLLMHPAVIILIAVLLIYIALSLFGCYELYMPRWLTNRQAGTSKIGGFVTAFLFGAISGTIASPCLSPGIIFMLTLVATLKSVIIGFVLLFAFGIGLSMPLLLLGTFSSSIALLPQAGIWMEEIKYIFGFIMLGMSSYFLSSLIPWYAFQAILAILCFSAGIFYLIRSKKFTGTAYRFYCILGMLLIAGSIVMAGQSVKTYFIPSPGKGAIDWRQDYREALDLAKQEQKKLFVCVHAPLCIACHELNDRLNSDARFISAIKGWIAASINLRDSSQNTKQFVQQFKIIGAPNCILIDPSNESIIKRWDYELTNEQLEELISILEADKK